MGSDGIDETRGDELATGETIATSSAPPAPKTISGTEETILPASEPPASSGAVAEPPAAGPTDDYGQLVVVDPQHYLLAGEVARGGMGRILRARDRRLGRTIAIKELLVRDPALAARFEREARITARLQHPAIVALHEAGRWPTGEPFFAMKLVSGRPLDKVIAGARTLRERLGLLANVIAVVDALAYAHSEGIVHRDLKPANVLVGDYGETVVIDWGLAKDLQADEPELGPVRATVEDSGATTRSKEGETLAGSIIGTPAYMPPEQAAGEKVDARADVYALGALLYHVLTGRAPYEAKTVETMLAKVLGGPPPPMQDLERDVPADLIAIVEKAMAREAADRFPTAREMVEELKRFQTGQLVTSHRYTAWELFRRWVRKHRGVVAVSALALVVLAVLGAFSVSRVVAARDRADRNAADALAAQTRAEQRTNQVTLAQATSSLDLDPTLSLALLGQVTTNGDPGVLRDMRRIASDAASRGVAFLLRGNGRVNALAISTDGKWLAAGGADRKLRVWDVAARTMRVLEGHEQPILDVVIANDSIVSVDARGAVRTWNITSGAGSVVRPAGSDTLELAKLAPAGKALATFRIGRTEIVDLVAGKTHEKAEYELGAWTPDGTAIVMFSDPEKEVHRFELATGAITSTIKAGNLVTAIATDGRRIIVGDEHERVRDLTSEVMVSSETKHAGMVTSLQLLADGTIVSASSDFEYTFEHHEVERRFRSGDYTVVVWPFEPHEAIRLRGHQGNIDAIAVTPTGKLVASAGRDGTIRVWSRPTIRRHYGHAQLDAAVLTADSRELAVINNGSELDVHEVGTDKFRTITVAKAPGAPERASADEAPRHQVAQIAVADGGKRFATLDAEPAVVVWDLAQSSGRLLARDIATLAITHDGTRVVTADRQGGVTSWDVATGAGQPIVPVGPATASSPDARELRSITAIAIAKAGTIAVAYEDGGVELVAPGPRRALTGCGDTLKTLAFSPDGATLVGGGDRAQLRVWTVATGALRSWPGHDDKITKLVFSPDGAQVASASDDNTARVWRLADGASTPLRGHAGTINTLVWRSDGASLVSAGDDRTVRLWDLPGGGHRVVARHGDYVVYAGFLAGEQRILSVDHADEIVEVPDDLPQDEPGLRHWLANATNMTAPQ